MTIRSATTLPVPADPTLVPSNDRAFSLPPIPADFGMTEEHALLAASARRWLAEKSPLSAVRRLASDPLGFDRDAWRELADLGWLAVTRRERESGEGLGPLQLCLVMLEMGRTLFPSPYFGVLLALAVLDRAANDEQRARWLAPAASGDRLASLALTEPGGSWEPTHVSVRAEPREHGFVLSGVKSHVLFAHAADSVVVPCREPAGGIGLYVVELPNPRVTVEPESGLDSTRRTSRVALDAVSIESAARLAGDGLEALVAARNLGAMLLAAEMVGAADAVLSMTTAYARERRQFGRAIGSFQAVKHPLVDMLIGIELAQSLALGAAAALEQGAPEADTTARMAKALCEDSLAFAVKKGVQLHGGFGFTWEADVHLYFRRLLFARATLGDATHHRRHVAGRLFGGMV